MKNFLFTVFLVCVITLVFLLFSSDINDKNRRFLSRYGIKTENKPVSFEEIEIPKSFDSVYEGYNIMQITAGLDLSAYKGKKAVRYTYKILNFPEKCDTFANVICVNGKPVAGDICCPKLDGFLLPLDYLK